MNKGQYKIQSLENVILAHRIGALKWTFWKWSGSGSEHYSRYQSELENFKIELKHTTQLPVGTTVNNYLLTIIQKDKNKPFAVCTDRDLLSNFWCEISKTIDEQITIDFNNVVTNLCFKKMAEITNPK